MASRKIIIHAPHDPIPSKLEEVIEEMKRLGPPRLYAYWRRKDKAWYALEGSHRIAAAHHLGLVPILKQVYLKSKINHDTYDVLPDREVRSVLWYYDDHKWWVKYAFQA